MFEALEQKMKWRKNLLNLHFLAVNFYFEFDAWNIFGVIDVTSVYYMLTVTQQ